MTIQNFSGITKSGSSVIMRKMVVNKNRVNWVVPNVKEVGNKTTFSRGLIGQVRDALG